LQRSEGEFEQMGFVPLGLLWEYVPSTKVSNINARQCLDNWPWC
jgi:hypothetical protein